MPSTATTSSHLLTLIAMVVVVAGLYFGRQVLIPLALAMVFAFLFTPFVDWLEKHGLGRVPTVLALLLLVFTLMGAIGWIVSGQLMEIVDQFPTYKSNVHDKIQSLRMPNGGRLRNAVNAVNELGTELSASSDSGAGKKAGTGSRARPIAVQVTEPPSDAPQYLREILGPLTGALETSAMVIVFTLFILIKREDLRNRFIRLAGKDQLNVITQALDDASQRLSRYLGMQFLVNATYGVIFGVGVDLIGVPHPLLWGVLASLLRFVPFVGTLAAAAFPMGLALAVFPGLHEAVMVFGLFLLLDLLTSNVVEPWLYGAHTGISSLAILVAAVFWAILWGPVGLILSTPLTVVLILMGRYVPQLDFLEILLGDVAPLPVEAHLYQRLLALDDEEARDIAEAYLKEEPIGNFYDCVLIPALTLSEQERHLSSLEARTANFVSQSAREMIEELGERSEDETSDRSPVIFNYEGTNDTDLEPSVLRGMRLVCIPAGDEADELVAMMAAQLLNRLGCEVRRVPLANGREIEDEGAIDAAQVALVSALSPFATSLARSRCKLLRQSHPELKIVLGLWSFKGGMAGARERKGLGSADVIATTLRQAVSSLVEIKQVLAVGRQISAESVSS